MRAEREANAAKLFQKTGMSKYILRFQSLGLKDLDVFKCSEAAQEYMEVWEAERECNPDDEDYQDDHDDPALKKYLHEFKKVEEIIAVPEILEEE